MNCGSLIANSPGPSINGCLEDFHLAREEEESDIPAFATHEFSAGNALLNAIDSVVDTIAFPQREIHLSADKPLRVEVAESLSSSTPIADQNARPR